MQACTLDLVIDQHLLVIDFPEPPDRRRENRKLEKGLGLTSYIEARSTPDGEDRLVVGSGRCRVHVWRRNLIPLHRQKNYLCMVCPPDITSHRLPRGV